MDLVLSTVLGPENYNITLTYHEQGSYVDGQIISPSGNPDDNGDIGPHPIDKTYLKWVMGGAIEIFRNPAYTCQIEDPEWFLLAVSSLQFELVNTQDLPISNP